MKQIAAYPKNEAHFLRLIRFGKEIIALCHSHGANPILYGSMAHFLHTGDKGMNVNDLDFLVPSSKLPGIFRALRRKGAKEFYWKVGSTHTPDLMRAARRAKGKTLLVRFPDWNGIVIVRGDLRVDLDDLVRTYTQDKRPPKDFVPLDFNGDRIRMISLPGLRNLYKVAYASEKGKDKARMKRKMKRMEASLKRK